MIAILFSISQENILIVSPSVTKTVPIEKEPTISLEKGDLSRFCVSESKFKCTLGVRMAYLLTFKLCKVKRKCNVARSLDCKSNNITKKMVKL